MNFFKKTRLAVVVAVLSAGSACSQDSSIDSPNDASQAAETSRMENRSDTIATTGVSNDLEQNNQRAYNSQPGEKEHTVYFQFDSAELTNDAKYKLSQLVEEMEGKNEPVSITLAGHTDQTGPEPYNEDLAERRAEAVKEFLKQNELEVSNVDIRAVGEARPVSEQEAENRRVGIEPEG